jgi:hypothetical protein
MTTPYLEVGDAVPICESAALEVADDGTIAVCYIKAGWSLNNRYWGADVLREAVDAGLFGPGLHNYWNHGDYYPRELSDLASAQVGPAEFREGGVYARVLPFSQVHDYTKAIAVMAPHIGMSIVSYIDSHPGEVDGREGEIVDKIRLVESNDYVTKPGAGGAVLEAAPAVEGVARRPRPPTPAAAPGACATVYYSNGDAEPLDLENSYSTFINRVTDSDREGDMGEIEDLKARVTALEAEVKERTAERDEARAEAAAAAVERARREIRDAVEAEVVKVEGIGAVSRGRIVEAVVARESSDRAKALLAVGEEVAREKQYIDAIRAEALAGQTTHPEPAQYTGTATTPVAAVEMWTKFFMRDGLPHAEAKAKAEGMVI